jgi:hypothetical protein
MWTFPFCRYTQALPFTKTRRISFFKDISEHYEKAYYKSTPGVYEDLVQVRTAAMSAADLLAARNYLEDKYKPPGWVKDHIDRRDLDSFYLSIGYAERKIGNKKTT